MEAQVELRDRADASRFPAPERGRPPGTVIGAPIRAAVGLAMATVVPETQAAVFAGMAARGHRRRDNRWLCRQHFPRPLR